MVLCKDGSVLSWGPNDSGQLGHGDELDRQQPHKVKGLSKINCIAVGDDFAFALGETEQSLTKLQTLS